MSSAFFYNICSSFFLLSEKQLDTSGAASIYHIRKIATHINNKAWIYKKPGCRWHVQAAIAAMNCLSAYFLLHEKNEYLFKPLVSFLIQLNTILTDGRYVHSTYSFPRDAITNYHKLGGLKQKNYILSFFLEARNPKSRFQCWFLLEALREIPFCILLPASGGCQQSLAFLGSYMHHSNLCFWLYMTFPICFSLFLVLFCHL